MKPYTKEEIENITFNDKIYNPMDDRITHLQFKCIALVNKYNKTKNTKLGFKKRDKYLKQMCGSVGNGCYLEPPVHANFGFSHVYLGNFVYANFNLTCVDDGKITIGDNTLIGPNVTLVTASHPISPTLRKSGIQYNKPINIGKNVWIGAGVIVFPGVSIGDNTVIGAGSLVTKDIPANVLAYGSPCKVVREITKDDEVYYDHDKLIKEVL